jgi:hypothetical protein
MYYEIIAYLKAKLLLDDFVNTVTNGDIFDVDLGKQTIFPLSHIIINSVAKTDNVMVYNVSILCMDIVDKNKDLTDNEEDVLNTQLAVGHRLVEVIERVDMAINGTVNFEPFTERFDNYLAGWSITFDLIWRNEMTICDEIKTFDNTFDNTFE